MPRTAVGLTAVKVKTAPPGRYGDGDGLYLLVRPGGTRYWLFRFKLAGAKGREMGLGRAGASRNAVTLADARKAASGLYAQVRAGVDPLADREAVRAATASAKVHTFADVARFYIAAHEATWRNPVHRRQWHATLTAYAYPHFGDQAVATVAVGDVLGALSPIWHKKPETAARVRGRIEAVLDYATASGWRTGDNPARWRGHLQNLLPARSKVRRVQHHAALPWPAMPGFVAALVDQGGTGALALQFAILTAARTGEVIGARWSELDLDAAVWTVPGARMKAGLEHRVPLTDAALAVLRVVLPLRPADGDDYVFTGAVAGRGLSDAAMSAVLKRMGRTETVHGFRSAFRDWASESTAFSREVAEAALAHTLRDKVEAAYRRGDLFAKRREMMAAWAAFCARSPNI